MPNQNPSPPALTAWHGVELGAARGDGAAIRELHPAAGGVDRGGKGALGGQVVFDEVFDAAHGRTNARATQKIKAIERTQSLETVGNEIN